MIVANWTTFRYHFADKAEASISGTFSAGPNRITRQVGSFISNGFQVGQDADVVGTTGNDRRFTVEGVAALYLTVTEAPTPEGPVACTVTGVFHDKDGMEQWPVDKMRIGALGNITGIPTPYTGSTFYATINGGAADGVFGVDEYDWYLSQRTDDPDKQLLTMIQKPPTATESYSGTVMIYHRTLCETEVGFTGTPSPEQVPHIFKYCYLYVMRKSPKSIQMADLLRAMTANY